MLVFATQGESLSLASKLPSHRSRLTIRQAVRPSSFDYACIRPISPNSGKRYNPLPNNPPTLLCRFLKDFLHECRDYLCLKAPSTNCRHAVSKSDQCFPKDHIFPSTTHKGAYLTLSMPVGTQHDQCGC